MKASGSSAELQADRKAARGAECRRLGAAVRSLREERGLSQQNLADALGVNRASVSGFEAGLHDLGMSQLRRLVDALWSTPKATVLLMSGHVAPADRRERAALDQTELDPKFLARLGEIETFELT